MPVVVGAAAELRNRDRLPGIDFPADSQPDPDRTAPAETPSPAKVGRERRQSRRRSRRSANVDLGHLSSH